MSGTLRFGVVLALWFTPFAAMANQAYLDIEQRLTAEQLRATGVDTLSSEQLKLLNRLLREESAKVGETKVLPGEAAPRGVVRRHAKDEPRRPLYDGLEGGQINSRLEGSVSGWEPGTVFELENGQKWKVLKGRAKLRETLQAPEIVVVPGIAGRSFLQVVEDMPKARVYRID